MSSRLCLGSVVCCLAFALPAAAQLDSYALRTKYGSPLNRETFHMPSGFDLIVDYGASKQVCKLEVPALMPAYEEVSNLTDQKQQMYNFLADLVPASMRGKELRRWLSALGTNSLSAIEYEHFTISELQDANHPVGKTITVRFNNDSCQEPTGQ